MLMVYLYLFAAIGIAATIAMAICIASVRPCVAGTLRGQIGRYGFTIYRRASQASREARKRRNGRSQDKRKRDATLARSVRRAGYSAAIANGAPITLTSGFRPTGEYQEPMPHMTRH